MELHHTSTLSQKEREDIRLISDQCRREDGLTLSCPEDGDEFWLLEEGGATAAFIAVYKMEESVWECYAFTRPDCRRKGYFSALLEQVCSWCGEPGEPAEGDLGGFEPGEPDLIFVTDNRCPAALAVLDRIGGELSWEEHMMEYEITGNRNQNRKLNPEAAKGDLILGICSGEDAPAPQPGAEGKGRVDWAGFSEDTLTIWGWEPDYVPDSEPAVTCRLTMSQGTAYLFSLETLPALRRRGMARRFLLQLFSLLADAGCCVLRLQVSGSNTPALELYKKTGFRITETLSYYLY